MKKIWIPEKHSIRCPGYEKILCHRFWRRTAQPERHFRKGIQKVDTGEAIRNVVQFDTKRSQIKFLIRHHNYFCFFFQSAMTCSGWS